MMEIIYEVSTFINVYFCKVAEPSSYPIIFSCDPRNEWTIKESCGELTGDQKPTGKKIWRHMSGSYMHM